MRAIGLALCLVAMSIALVGCQGGSANQASQLDVGNCFNYTEGVDANGNSQEDIAVVDCNDPHSDEVFAVLEYPNASAFPGYEQIGTFQQTQCEAAFKAYVGVDWEDSSYVINYQAPDEPTWNSGDHDIRCLIEDGNGGQLTGSARGTAK